MAKFLDEAKEGVIFFSWGSHYRDTDPEGTMAALMDVFSRVKQKVLFKWQNSTVLNKPPNVLIKTWVPQISVLSRY